MGTKIGDTVQHTGLFFRTLSIQVIYCAQRCFRQTKVKELIKKGDKYDYKLWRSKFIYYTFSG
jgi:hypothetical protein